MVVYLLPIFLMNDANPINKSSQLRFLKLVTSLGMMKRILTVGWLLEWGRGVPHCIPSGERLHSNGKSPFLMGKSTINGHFPLLC